MSSLCAYVLMSALRVYVLMSSLRVHACLAWAYFFHIKCFSSIICPWLMCLVSFDVVVGLLLCCWGFLGGGVRGICHGVYFVPITNFVVGLFIVCLSNNHLFLCLSLEKGCCHENLQFCAILLE